MDEGEKAFHAVKFKAALKLLLPLANTGNAKAEYMVGSMYGDGSDGVSQDTNKAVFWWHKAAIHGDARAQAKLGWAYESGVVVKQDYAAARKWYLKSAAQGNPRAEFYMGRKSKMPEEALSWYRKAAIQGDTEAIYRVGYHYEKGWGVEQNYIEAAKWYENAAQQNDMASQIALGRMYEDGLGVPKDLVQAYMWYFIPAQAGGTIIIMDGQYPDELLKRISSRMTPEQNAEGKARAAKWSKEAASHAYRYE